MRALLTLGLAAIGLMVAGLAAPPALSAASGGTRAEFYVSLDKDPALPRLSVRFDRVIYALSLAGGKYRVFPVTIETRPDAARLVLSPQEDAVAVIADGREVRGILDLAAADPALWDGLDAGLRQALLYPGAIEAGDTRIVYVLAPAAEIAGMPESFAFSIQSLGRPLTLVRPPPKAE